MKKLLLFLLLLPYALHAQTSQRVLVGKTEHDCYRYILERLIAKDTVLGNLVPQLMRAGVKTLFVQKTPATDSLPNTIGGYTIKYVDPVADAKKIYAAFEDSTACMLYMSAPQKRYSYADISIIPMYMTKTGKEITAEYTTSMCTCSFFVYYAANEYFYDHNSCR